MTTIHDVLDRIRVSSETEKEKGDKFERLMLAFFRIDPTLGLTLRRDTRSLDLTPSRP